jgi:hypothetical protein
MGLGEGVQGRGRTQLKSFRIYIVVFLITQIGFLFFLAYNSRFVMDEFKQGGMAYYINKGFYEGIIPTKTLLYAYFYQIAHILSDDSFQIMLIAREQTALLGCLTLCILFFIARNIGRDRIEALLIICTTLAFSTFIERIFRVRSEPLALFFTMMSLWLVSSKRQAASKIFLAGIFSGLSFLTTQKAIYFNIALGSALIINGLMTSSFKSTTMSIFLLISGWIVSLLLYSFYFRGVNFYEVIYLILTKPANLAVHGGKFYENLSVFIKNTLIRNSLLYLFGAVGWLFLIHRFRYMEKQERICWIFSGLITLFVFTHSQPWPYVFIWCIPFIALWSDRSLSFFATRYGRKLMAIILIVIAVLSLFRNMRYVGHSNVIQRNVLNQAQSLLRSQDSYCDGIGMIVNRVHANRPWWDKAKLKRILQNMKTGQSKEIEESFLKQPKVWILTYRTDKLKQILNPYFNDSYLRIFPNVLISGIRVTSTGDVKFINRWEGEYRLFSSKGRPLRDSFSVNGRIISGSVEIPLGESLLRLNGLTPIAYLLPADIRVPFKITENIKQIPLFGNVYDY